MRGAYKESEDFGRNAMPRLRVHRKEIFVTTHSDDFFWVSTLADAEAIEAR